MKKTVLIILSAIALYSCGGPEKPKKLLSEKEMESILYDMSLLQAIKSFAPQTLVNNKVDSRNYIYSKYKIDSLTFVQNHLYYAQDLKAYKRMQGNITAKIKAERDKLTPKKEKKQTKKEDTLPSPKITTPANLSPEKKAEVERKRDSVRDARGQNFRKGPSGKL